jgi:hypothetical protein
MPRPLREIADDIADLLTQGIDVDNNTIDAIEQQLCTVRKIYGAGAGVTKADAIRADIATERRRLQRLKQKWSGNHGVVVCLEQADQWLAVLSTIRGPDPRFRWFGEICAIMAHSMLLRSHHKRLGERLRILAGYLYEAATGIPNQSLETACRRIVKGEGPLGQLLVECKFNAQ